MLDYLKPNLLGPDLAIGSIDDLAVHRTGIAGLDNINAVILDADSTLVKHHREEISPLVREKLEQLIAAYGDKICILSNRDSELEQIFAEYNI